MNRVVLLITFMLLVINTIVSHSTSYPTVNTLYEAHLYFENFPVIYDDGIVFLNGTVDGLLEIKYIFREQNVYAYIRYREYRLNGFENQDIKASVENLLNTSRVYKYVFNEQPLPITEPYIFTNKTPYYVNPSYLDIRGVISQQPYYSLGGSSILAETRFFRYDPVLGIMVEMNVTSKLMINASTYKYGIYMRIVDCDKTIVYENLENNLLLLIPAMVFATSLLIKLTNV